MNLNPLLLPFPPEISNPCNYIMTSCNYIMTSKIEHHEVCSITMQRTKAQLTPLKKGCRLISSAPSCEPNRFLGSLCNNRYINCFAERLTCTRPRKEHRKKRNKRKFIPRCSIFYFRQINDNIHIDRINLASSCIYRSI